METITARLRIEPEDADVNCSYAAVTSILGNNQDGTATGVQCSTDSVLRSGFPAELNWIQNRLQTIVEVFKRRVYRSDG
jgi:hypothetical protein